MIRGWLKSHFVKRITPVRCALAGVACSKSGLLGQPHFYRGSVEIFNGFSHLREITYSLPLRVLPLKLQRESLVARIFALLITSVATSVAGD